MALGFIEGFVDKYGHAPSYREIHEGTGITMSAIGDLLDLLQSRGHLTYASRKARSITLTQWKRAYDSLRDDVAAAIDLLERGDTDGALELLRGGS